MTKQSYIKALANFLVQVFIPIHRANKAAMPFGPQVISRLVRQVESGEITFSQAKQRYKEGIELKEYLIMEVCRNAQLKEPGIDLTYLRTIFSEEVNVILEGHASL